MVNNKSNSAVRALVERYDLTGSGDVSSEEVAMAQQLLEIDLREQKAEAQKKMAWAAIVSMIVFTVLLFSPWVPAERVSAVSDLLGLFYLAQAGVVGAYMGFTTWMGKHNH